MRGTFDKDHSQHGLCMIAPMSVSHSRANQIWTDVRKANVLGNFLEVHDGRLRSYL